MLGVNHERKYYTQMRRFVSLARCQRLVVGIGVVLVGATWLSGARHHAAPATGDRATTTIHAVGSPLHSLTPPPLEGDHHLVTLIAAILNSLQ
jgi:hypothetical protein